MHRRGGGRVLNVAEKPSVAKEISRVLSNGQARARDGLTPWNKVWEFPYVVRGRQVSMVFTSPLPTLFNADRLLIERLHLGWHLLNILYF